MAVILADDASIRTPELPVTVLPGPQVEFTLPREQRSLAELEKRYIEQVYCQAGFHKAMTSAILGVSR
jgi:hypothetical protein